MKTKPKKVTLRDCTVLRDLCDRRIIDLVKKIGQCAGSLYPNIMTGQIQEIRDLFKKITGHPLETEGVDYGGTHD